MRTIIFFAVIGAALAQAPQTPAGPSPLPGVSGDGAGGLKTRGNVTVGASTACPGGAPAGSVCAVKVYGDGSALTGVAAGGDGHTQNTDTGTTSASFCLSTTGPCFKNVAGTIKMVTDSAGATDAPIEASEFNAPAGTAFSASGATQTAPTVTVPTAYFDTAAGLMQFLNAASALAGTMVAPLADPGADHQWVKYIPTTGTPARTRPSCADLSDAGSGCTGTVGANPVTSDSVITDLYSVIGDGGARKVKVGPAIAQTATASTIAQRNSSGEVIAVNAVATGKTAMATDTVVADAQLNAKYKVWARDVVIFDPAILDSGRAQFRLPFAGTVTSISCSVEAATSVTINFDERAVATPNTTGTAVLTSDLVCDADSAVSTTFSNATLAADVPVAMTVSAVTGTPSTVRAHIKGTID